MQICWCDWWEGECYLTQDPVPDVQWGQTKLNVYWLMVGLLVAVVVTGWCSKNLVLSQKIPLYPLWGPGFCRRAQRYCYVYSLSRAQDPSLIEHSGFLIVPPLFKHSLFSWLGDFWICPFGTQGRLRRMKPLSCK